MPRRCRPDSIAGLIAGIFSNRRKYPNRDNVQRKALAPACGHKKCISVAPDAITPLTRPETSWHHESMTKNIQPSPFKDTSTPPSLATIPYFSVQGGTHLVIPGPIPRNIAQTVVRATEDAHKWECIRTLRTLMRPWAWLDMVLRLQQGMEASPMPIREELLASFKHYRYRMALGLNAQTWWTSSSVFRIYRGAYAGVNERGMCWTVDPKMACRYAKVGGCGEAAPLLIVGAVHAQDCIAHQLHRDELQVLVDPEKVTFLARYTLPIEDESVLQWYLRNPDAMA